jgi:hypothetical protein
MPAINMLVVRIAQNKAYIVEMEKSIESIEQSIQNSKSIIQELKKIVYDLRRAIDMKPLIELMKNGRNIEAIRKYQALAGYDFEEAQDYMESYYLKYSNIVKVAQGQTSL